MAHPSTFTEGEQQHSAENHLRKEFDLLVPPSF